MTRDNSPLRVGIGGPVGSGKTALTLALCKRILLELAQRIAPAVEAAAAMDDGDLFNLAPGLALASARHETQYSRIFRS
jgi:urease accessory protein UreF